MNPLTVYAQKTPGGVAIFRDAAATVSFCHYSLETHRRLPDRRNKWLMLNCYRWRVQWL